MCICLIRDFVQVATNSFIASLGMSWGLVPSFLGCQCTWDTSTNTIGILRFRMVITRASQTTIGKRFCKVGSHYGCRTLGDQHHDVTYVSLGEMVQVLAFHWVTWQDLSLFGNHQRLLTCRKRKNRADLVGLLL